MNELTAKQSTTPKCDTCGQVVLDNTDSQITFDDVICADCIHRFTNGARICENPGCNITLPHNWSAVYCSNHCAREDA